MRGQTRDGERPVRELTIDATIRLPNLQPSLLDELQRLAPFGAGNPEPLFEARGVTPIQARTVSGKSLRLRFRQGSETWPAFAYGMGSRIDQLRRPVDIVFHPRMVQNSRGRRLELVVRDFAPAS